MIQIIWNILLFALSAAGLIWAAGIAVKQLNKMAHLLKFSEFVTAFLLMAVATTIPELFVGLNSIFKGAQELALGDTIGSNIVDLTLVAGLIVLFGKGLPARGKLVKKDMLVLLGISILPLLLGGDGKMSRLDGVLLLVVYGLYLWFQVKIADRFKRTMAVIRDGKMLGVVGIFLGAVLLLLLSSFLLVNSAVFFSTTFKIPEILLGMSLIALGTSVPELSFVIRALREGHPEMVLGDLVGAFAANIAGILGLVALLAPVTITSMPVFLIGAIALPIVIGIFFLMSSTREKITWREALGLFLLYILFVYLQALFK